MSETNPKITELLRRYLSGAITAPEEAELERFARTDETLREAMNGFQSAPEEDHLARIERMKTRARQQAAQGAQTQVQGKVKGREGQREGAAVRPLQRYRYYAAAAVLLLLVSVVFLLPRFQDEAFSSEVAMKAEPVQEISAPEPTNLEEEMPAPQAEAQAPPAAENEPSDPRTGATTTVAAPQPALKKLKDVVVSPVSPPPPPVAQEDATDDLSEELSVAEEVVTTTTAAPTASPQLSNPVLPPVQRSDAAAAKVEVQAERERMETARSRSQPRQTNEADNLAATSDAGYSISPAMITGRVTNENGDPIINALVRQPGLPIGQRTDSNGVFQISADATATMLDISHPDFNEERVDVKSRGENLQITLEQEEKIDFEEWRKTWGATKIPLSKPPGYALPEEGYNALRKRIETNKPNGIPAGKIKFSFLVDTDGTLSDFVFRGKPEQATMDYIGETIMNTSIWNVVKGEEPVRVYFKVVFE